MPTTPARRSAYMKSFFVSPMVLTSNKGFDEWGGVLDDEAMAAALIDRLLHHCHIVNVRGDGYRMSEYQYLPRSGSTEVSKGAVDASMPLRPPPESVCIISTNAELSVVVDTGAVAMNGRWRIRDVG